MWRLFLITAFIIFAVGCGRSSQENATIKDSKTQVGPGPQGGTPAPKTNGVGPGQGATTPKTGGGQIQISPEMQAFLAAMNGDANSVDAAFKKFAAKDVQNPDNITIYSLGSPNVIKKEQRQDLVCYTVVTKAGVTTRTWEICWSGAQISSAKQLKLSFE